MTNRYGDEPLGKSVEQVERESGNLVNSPVEGEVMREREVTEALVVPAIPNANQTGTPAVMVNPAGLVESGSGADDGRATPPSDETV
ncbi:hypothetical protein ACINK0_11765 [Deinococcus sp. VB343]|uniref:hypothetical protein n=1 Tax=Deinococcus sp. VB343 TaxID=3385567 RepID=UPI0039C9DF72